MQLSKNISWIYFYYILQWKKIQIVDTEKILEQHSNLLSTPKSIFFAVFEIHILFLLLQRSMLKEPCYSLLNLLSTNVLKRNPFKCCVVVVSHNFLFCTMEKKDVCWYQVSWWQLKEKTLRLIRKVNGLQIYWYLILFTTNSCHWFIFGYLVDTLFLLSNHQHLLIHGKRRTLRTLILLIQI